MLSRKTPTEMPLICQDIIGQRNSPKHTLHILMPERLISRAPIPNVVQRHVRRLIAWPALIALLRRSICLSTPQRTLHPLVLVWALLVPESAPCWSVAVSLDLVASSTATALKDKEVSIGSLRKVMELEYTFRQAEIV